jgi:hypothetical protein
MKVYQKILNDKASEITHTEFMMLKRMGDLCVNIHPKDLIKQLDAYNEFLSKEEISYEDSILEFQEKK